MSSIHRLVYAALAASSLALAPTVRAADGHHDCGEACPCQHANGSDAKKANSKGDATVKFEAPQQDPAWMSGP